MTQVQTRVSASTHDCFLNIICTMANLADAPANSADDIAEPVQDLSLSWNLMT